MTPDRWQQIRDLLEGALQLEPTQRSAYLEQHCSSDPSLRQDVNSFLAAERELHTSFLESPAISMVVPGKNVASGADWAAGTMLGPYEIQSLLGAGGMGEVYRAFRADDQYSKQVAIKLVRVGRDSKAVVQRFKNERQILAGLDHPNIARLHDGGETEDGLPYFVMELIEGMPIDKYCDDRKLTITGRLELFRQVCSAVQYAHRHLTIHRDIKPGNILVTPDGVPKLLDFGIARMLDPTAGECQLQPTLTIFRAMTPGYASPEQMTGAAITTASDLYSLGVVLYELLTGCSPYRLTGGNPQEIARAVCEIEPERPSTVVRRIQPEEGGNGSAATLAEVAAQRQATPDKLNKRLDGDLDNIVLMALRKEPQRRYPSVEQFSLDIQRHLGNLPVMARRDTARYRTSKFVARHRAGVAAAAAIFLTLVLGMAATLREAQIARAQRARAERRFNDVRKVANSMIFDLPGPIHALPGSVSVENLLFDTGLKYLDSLAEEAEGDASLQRELAAGYKRLGDSKGTPYGGNLGDSAGALASYRKALQMRLKLVQRDSHDLLDQINLAMTFRTIGSLVYRMGDLQAGRENAHKALDIARPIAEAQPDNVDALRELSVDYLVVGNVESEGMGKAFAGNPAVALQYHLDALRVIRQLAAKHGDERLWQQGIAYLSGVVSSDYLASAKPVESIQYASQGFQLLSPLDNGADISIKSVLKNQRADLHSKLGDALLFSGRWNEATSEYNSELVLFREAFDPRDVESRGLLAEGYINLGHSQASLGNAKSGLPLLRKGLEILEPRLKSDPKNIEVAGQAADGYVYEGEALEQLGDEPGALDLYTKASMLFESSAAEGKLSINSQTAAGYAKVAASQAKLGRSAKAREKYLKALELVEPRLGAKPVNVQAQYVLIDVYYGMGDLASQRAARDGSRVEEWNEAGRWYKKSLDTWQQLPLRNSVAPNGFKVTGFNTVAAKLARCNQVLQQRLSSTIERREDSVPKK